MFNGVIEKQSHSVCQVSNAKIQNLFEMQKFYESNLQQTYPIQGIYGNDCC
jgi:hypothetical protein